MNVSKVLIRFKFCILLFAYSGLCSGELEEHKTGPQIVISDAHIGTTMWQMAVLKAIGMPAEAYTFSSHRHYAPDDPSFRSNPLFDQMASWSEEKVHEEFNKNPRWSSLKYALCSFPPSYVKTLEKLPPQVNILLNVGHRIHITLPGDQVIPFNKWIIDSKDNPRYTIATMSEYDYHYIHYYTKLKPLRLSVISQHIPQKLREAPYAPTNRVVLIGPSHNTSTIIGFNNNLEDLNRKSAAFAARFGLEPYTFEYIKAFYPNDQATFENLAKHPAVLMNPYSAFSISMVELYQLNIPFFVPKDLLLVNEMGDVRLDPIYQNKETVAKLESEYPVSSSGYPYSPNDDSRDAQLYWFQYMFFNQVEHAQHWTSPEDLFYKLYFTDLRSLHDEMQAENTQLFKDQLQKWKNYIN